MSSIKNINLQKLKLGKYKNVFFIFLFLATMLWLMTNLSKDYTNTVVFDINYVNTPSNKLLQDYPKEVKVIVKAPGFSLLRYKMRQKKITVNLENVRPKKGSVYYYLPNKHLSEFDEQVASNVTVSEILKDTLFFVLSHKITKKVPVISEAKINYKLGYNLSDRLIVKPEFITITGVKTAIDTILFVKTVPTTLKDVDAAINKKILLQLPKISEVSYSNTTVTLSGNVEKFTEGAFDVAFKIQNLPEGYTINTIPEKVTIKYQVSLSNFNIIKPSSFIVVCDYKETLANNVAYLTPKIMKMPSITSEVKMSPQKIEFLITK